jgi:hypothetical protein
MENIQKQNLISGYFSCLITHQLREYGSVGCGQSYQPVCSICRNAIVSTNGVVGFDHHDLGVMAAGTSTVWALYGHP